MKKIYSLFCIIFFISLATSQHYSNADINKLIKQQQFTRNDLLTINFNQNKSTAGVFQLRRPTLGIPTIYTIHTFEKIYPNHIQADQKVKYLAQYAQSWLNFLNNVQLVNYKKPQQLLPLIQRFASKTSPLAQINTLYRNNIPASIAKLNHELNAFYQLPTINAPYGLNQLQQLFTQLYNYLKPLNDDQKQRAAFQLASARIKNQGRKDPLSKLYEVAHSAPQPLQYWLYQLAQNTWQMILTNAQQYINQQWVQLVIPFNQEFAETFPFNPSASQQANMNNFVNDFAPDGAFDNFTTRYLKPFINTYQNPWTTKELDGDGLQLSNSTLRTLQTPQTIQHLFFPHGDTHISVPFSLETLSIPKTIKSIVVKIGKQTFSYNGPKQIAKLAWPNLEDINGTTSIEFIDNHNKKISFKGVGPWGWWEVIKQGKIKSSNQNQAWIVIFKVNGQNIQMGLYTDTTSNPFDLKRFSNFRLPTQLK